jgi:hypothetical protein
MGKNDPVRALRVTSIESAQSLGSDSQNLVPLSTSRALSGVFGSLIPSFALQGGVVDLNAPSQDPPRPTLLALVGLYG